MAHAEKLEKEMEGTQKAKNAKARMREYVGKNIEEDEQVTKKKDEKEEKGEEVNKKTNVEGDKTIKEEREKWKRGESEDDDAMKHAMSNSTGQVSVEEAREMDREERKRNRERESDQGDGRFRDIDHVDVVRLARTAEVPIGEEEGWRGAEVVGGSWTLNRREQLGIHGQEAGYVRTRDVRGRSVVRDKRPTTSDGGFKVKGVEEREDLFAAVPPLEPKKLMFRMVAVVTGIEEVKLMFIDLRKAHLIARCDEE